MIHFFFSFLFLFGTEVVGSSIRRLGRRKRKELARWVDVDGLLRARRYVIGATTTDDAVVVDGKALVVRRIREHRGGVVFEKAADSHGVSVRRTASP